MMQDHALENVEDARIAAPAAPRARPWWLRRLSLRASRIDGGDDPARG